MVMRRMGLHRIAGLAAATLLSVSGARAQTPSDGAAAVELTTVAAVRDLCLATRRAERVLLAGEGKEREDSAREWRQRRQQLLSRLYRMNIPARGFSLESSREAEEELPLNLERGWRAHHGAVTLELPRNLSLSFIVPPDEAVRAREHVESSEAVLDVYFELGETDRRVCSGSSAAGVYRLHAIPAAVELRSSKGELLARLETPRADAHREILGGYSGVPSATIGAVTVAGSVDPEQVRQRLAPLAAPMRRCYVKRLVQRPGASGTIIVGVEVGRNGRVSGVDFIADATSDEGLRRCVAENLQNARFSGMSGLPLLFRVPFEFKRVPR